MAARVTTLPSPSVSSSGAVVGSVVGACVTTIVGSTTAVGATQPASINIVKRIVTKGINLVFKGHILRSIFYGQWNKKSLPHQTGSRIGFASVHLLVARVGITLSRRAT
jgi:hypothetical protein